MPIELTLLGASTVLLFAHVMIQGQTATRIAASTGTPVRATAPHNRSARSPAGPPARWRTFRKPIRRSSR